jgi:ATP-binding cassette subfamily C protein LapB
MTSAPSDTATATATAKPRLLAALLRLAELQREPVDRLAFQEAVQHVQAAGDAAPPMAQISLLTRHLGLKSAIWLKSADPSNVPALVHDPMDGWGVLVGQNSQKQWVVLRWDEIKRAWSEGLHDDPTPLQIAKLRLAAPFELGKSPVFALIRSEIAAQKGRLVEAVVGGLIIGILGLITSFYSLQIYDRVIPTGAMQTLMVLSLGALIAIGLDWMARSARTKLYELIIDEVDQRMARTVYLRLLAVRLDQMPKSVGSLASQMRGYETVRSFLTQVTTSVLVDMPFAVLFLVIMATLSGQLVIVPLLFFVLALGLGLSTRTRMEEAAKRGAKAGNFKTGLLVETVEGAETLKSGQGGWRMLGRWLHNVDEARDAELQSRHLSEHFQHLISSFQQMSYVLLVAFGAWLVTKGELTQGGLIACTILSGRVLSPVAAVAAQALQWSYAKAALEGLDALWRLENDHHDHEPVVLDHVHGNYQIDKVTARYGASPALVIPQLNIKAGERIGIIGPVGAGKTTLLRLLSGMYKPQEGRILLDGVDLSHIAKAPLSERIGYLQQEGRLFAGTLRENLLLGMADPGDPVILAAAQRTGLMPAVITPHPRGLQQEIYEGGTGLSGGQRQLVNLTRVVLREPTIWLLDEPTSSVDGNSELQIKLLLQQTIASQHTLVLVTHKPDMLQLVDRILVVAGHQVVMDGPKEQVMARLNANGAAA